MLDDDLDDDTHLCIKCSATIIGLDNYVKHRKNLCSRQLLHKTRFVAPVTLNPSTTTDATTQSTISRNTIGQPYSTYSFAVDGAAFAKCDHDAKTSKTLTDSYDLTYELGADVFFSSLELQSVQATNGKTTTNHNALSRKGSSVWIEDSTSRRNSENLMKAVQDISGVKKIDNIFTPITYEHESPEPSDDNEDNNYNDEDYEQKIILGNVVSKGRTTGSVIPTSHTGGKWKPENRPKQLSLSWPESPVRQCSWDANQIESNFPPDGYTKGKWIPGTKVEKLQYKQTVTPSNLRSHEFWCQICCRKLKNKFLYENHLKTNFHLKRCEPERQLEKASLDKIPNYELVTDLQESITLVQSDPIGIASNVKRNRRRMYATCEVCNHKIAKNILGKHLISHYHYVRTALSPYQSFNMILNNIHSIVLQSPFQCRPCRFYANTENTFLLHWNSLVHQVTTEGPGKFLCSYCRFIGEDNNQMKGHLLSADHKEVIMAINRSVPISITKILCIKCPECCQQFKYNIELRKHYQQSHSSLKCGGTASDFYQCRFNCLMCTDVFKSKIALQRHQKFKHEKSVFFCSNCEMHFGTLAEAKKHRKTLLHRRYAKNTRKTFKQKIKLDQRTQNNNSCIPLNSMKCSVCNFSSNSEVEIMLHEITHTTNNVMKCPKKEPFPKFVNISSESTELRYKRRKCHFCKKELTDYKALKLHIEEHHSEFRYQCIFCGENFPLLQMLGNHVKHKMCIEPSSTAFKKVQSGRNVLDVCVVHATDEKIFKCQECTYRASCKADVILHQMYHKFGKLNPSSKLKCPVCPKSFEKNSLRWHLRRHTKEKIFGCKMCSKKFLRRHTLKNHMRSHSDGELVLEIPKKVECFQCGQCAKTFKKKYSLKMHLINHDKKETKFLCQVEGCNYNARDQHTLNIHLISHSKENSFECTQEGCKYKGKSSFHLKRHTKIHDDSRKELKCTECEFKAKIPGHIKRHMRIHTGEKPYQCPHCEYKSGFQENLRKHILTTNKHTGKFIYECPNCNPNLPDEIFKTNFYGDFLSHQSSKHPGINLNRIVKFNEK